MSQDRPKPLGPFPQIVFTFDKEHAEQSEAARRERERMLRVGISINDLDQYIRNLPKHPPQPAPPSKPVETTVSTVFRGTNRCDTTSVTDGSTFADIGAFASSVGDALFPGSVIRGESIDFGLLSQISLKRAPLFLTILNIGNPKSTGPKIPPIALKVDHPILNTVQTAVRALVNVAIEDGVAPNIFQEILEFRSTEHAGIQLHASARGFGANISTAFETSSSVEDNNLSIFLQQNYYTVAVNGFANPGDLFDRGVLGSGIGGVSVSDLAKVLGPNPAMPVYISTISYGRILSLSVSTHIAASDARFTLNAAMNGLIASGSVDIKILNSELVQKSVFRLLILGGPDPTLHQLPGPDAFQVLIDEWNKGIKFTRDTPAVPISYAVKFIGDSAIASLNLTTTFQRFQCNPARIARLGVQFQTEDDDKDGGEFISLQIHNGSQQVFEIMPIPQSDYQFPDHSSEPGPDPYVGGVPNWYSKEIDASLNLTTADCKNLIVTVIKSNGNSGWNFNMAAAMFLENNPKSNPILFLQTDSTQRMGDDQPNQKDFRANRCG
jgi:hypothetical protein